MREGWEREILKKVTIFKSGKTVSKDVEKSSGSVLYTKVGDMNLVGNEVNITTSSRFVDFSDINENQIIPIGSVIFPKRGGAIATNKKRKIIKPTIVDLNTMAIVPSDKLFSEYLCYWLQSIDLQELSNVTSIPQINNNSFDNVYISYPSSLQEQQKIVAILDEAFEAINQAKANIEKNIANAQELFQSKLNEIFSQRGEGWEEKKLKELCLSTSNIKWQEYKNETFEYIDLSSVSRDTLTVTETSTINNENAPSRAKQIVLGNDVIFATTRPTLKRVTLITEEYHNQICSTGYAVLRANQEVINPNWIYYFIQTDLFMKRMEKLQRGASYP